MIANISNGFNFLRQGVQKGAQGVSNAALGVSNVFSSTFSSVSQLGPVKKITDVCNPIFRSAADSVPNALKWKWSTGTFLFTTVGYVALGIILKRKQTNLSKIEEVIKAYEQKPPRERNWSEQRTLFHLKAERLALNFTGTRDSFEEYKTALQALLRSTETEVRYVTNYQECHIGLLRNDAFDIAYNYNR